MQLICPRCQTTNERDAHFCKICGTGFDVEQVRRSSAAVPLLVIFIVIAVCGLCGIFGLFTGNKTDVAVNAGTATAKSLTGGVPTVNASSESKLSEPSANTNKTGDVSAKGAVVISENANLRQTPDANGAVIETLAENTETEVIRQKGGWFYVRAGGKTGWLHGNTIRLSGYSSSEAVNKTPDRIRSAAPPEDLRAADEETGSADRDDGDIADSSRYVTGPRGWCYYINRNGNKTYVDRSLCGGTSTGSKSSSLSSSSSNYIRGPRGGCYYINRNGNKTYVDRSLCN